MFDHTLDQDKRRTNIDIHRMIELLQTDIPNIRYPFTVSRVRYKNVRSLPKVSFYLIEHLLDLLCGGDIDLVNRDGQCTRLIGIRVCPFQLVGQSFDTVQIGRVCQGEIDAFLG